MRVVRLHSPKRKSPKEYGSCADKRPPEALNNPVYHTQSRKVATFVAEGLRIHSIKDYTTAAAFITIFRRCTAAFIQSITDIIGILVIFQSLHF